MKIEVLKPTNDNWCGSYQINGHYKGVKNKMLVEVKFLGNIGGGVWRTCVWGNDDCGMEFDCDSEAECLTVFLQVIGMEFVDKTPLRNLGFVSA